MVKCQVTRHLNGAVKCFIIQEEDEVVIINMDKVSIIAFETVDDRGMTKYSMTVHKEDSYTFFYFNSHSNFKEVSEFVTSELTRP